MIELSNFIKLQRGNPYARDFCVGLCRGLTSAQISPSGQPQVAASELQRPIERLALTLQV